MIKNCIEITQIASDAQERPLTSAEKLHLHTHILICRGCRAYYKNTKVLTQMMQAMKSQDEADSNKSS